MNPRLPAVLFDAADTLIELTPAFPELLSTAWLGSEGAPSAEAVRQALWAIGSEGDWPDDEPDADARLTMWTVFFREALRRAGGADSPPPRTAPPGTLSTPRTTAITPTFRCASTGCARQGIKSPWSPTSTGGCARSSTPTS